MHSHERLLVISVAAERRTEGDVSTSWWWCTMHTVQPVAVMISEPSNQQLSRLSATHFTMLKCYRFLWFYTLSAAVTPCFMTVRDAALCTAWRPRPPLRLKI